jgi:acetyltransferase-like isoleucine patch superfamily enzyme
MRRDFASESLVNLVLRAWRSASGRARGRAFAWLKLFAAGSSSRLYFGRGARFINSKSIRLGPDVHFGINARLECYAPFDDAAKPKIDIGAGTSFGDNFHAGAVTGITIGRNVLGASGVLLLDHNHGNPRADVASEPLTDPKARPLLSRGPIVVGDSVWLGEGVIVLGGSTIGEGAVIGAGAVVRGHVPARAIYTGSSA